MINILTQAYTTVLVGDDEGISGKGRGYDRLWLGGGGGGGGGGGAMITSGWGGGAMITSGWGEGAMITSSWWEGL